VILPTDPPHWRLIQPDVPAFATTEAYDEWRRLVEDGGWWDRQSLPCHVGIIGIVCENP